MTNFQKVIKYGAIAFGVYLAFVIISMIVFGLTILFGIFIGIDTEENNKEIRQEQVSVWENTYESEKIEKLDIDLGMSKLTIKTGDALKVEVENESEHFVTKVEEKTLKIKETGTFNFWYLGEKVIPEITLHVPEDFVFDEVEIRGGINEKKIENLKAKKVEIENAVGKSLIKNLTAEVVKLKGGAGETQIKGCHIQELDLEAGVGKVLLEGKIQEKAKLKAGVGKLEIYLQGKLEDYEVKAKTGLGPLKVNGEKVGDNQKIGNGEKEICIEAGVGETILDFLKEKTE